MSTNDPLDPQRRRDDDGDTHSFGDLQVSTGRQSAYITLELILYVLVTLGIFITSAIVQGGDDDSDFGASEAWFYVTLLTVGFLISRGLAKINWRGGDNRTF